jgi:hypothetical protein
MVEDKLVEEAMVKFKPVLDDFKNSPTDTKRLTNLQSAALDLAHAIQAAIESAWGRDLSSPSRAGELSMPTIAGFKNGDDPSARELDISGEHPRR